MRSKMGIRILTWLLVLILMVPMDLGAQQAEQGQETSMAQNNTYTQEQLDQLLAPIALYPDTLLSQILMASTYPLEVVEADRWLKQNPNLTGDRLDKALKGKSWDVSVKSLCHFPQALSMMDDKLPETTDLGNAFLGQQDQVMDTIQKLRARAQAQGNLKSMENQKVVDQDQDIIIEPTSPDVIYVPAYDPCWVYGPWWYPTCSPFWFWYPSLVVSAGFFWGPGIFIGPIDFWCGFFWHRHSIFVNVNKTAFINRIGASRMHGGIETWTHDPLHRRGVAYHDTATAQRFGRAGVRGVEARHAFRGFASGGRGTAQVMVRGIGRPRGSSAFHGFGRGIESQQHSERGRQSVSIGSRSSGGFRPGRGGGAVSRGGGFSGGGHAGGGNRIR